MVLAQGQARLDASQAFAVTAGASLPWLVVAVVGVACVVLLATVLAMFSLALVALRGGRSTTPAGEPRVAILTPRRRALSPRAPEPPAALVIDEEVFYQPVIAEGGNKPGSKGGKNPAENLYPPFPGRNGAKIPYWVYCRVYCRVFCRVYCRARDENKV